ncbi:hypothetical protein ACFLQU_04080 [Verrucomicrobiota bacterium]
MSTKKRFLVIVEDDFELMGDGGGNVADLQYLPSAFLADVGEELGIKFSFMVDVAQQLTVSRYSEGNPGMRLQKELWDLCVRMLKERGFDVQLHLHPQWYAATYEAGLLTVGDNWNIGKCPGSVQKEMIDKSVRYLADLLGDIEPGYSPVAFKAGMWGLQPSAPLLGHLAAAGIRIVAGVRHGMSIPHMGVDYRRLEEPFQPYHPRMDDVTKLAETRNQLIVVPLQAYNESVAGFLRMAWDNIGWRRESKRRVGGLSGPLSSMCARPRSPSRGLGQGKIAWPYVSHLRMGFQSFHYLKSAFDMVIGRLRRLDVPRIPVLIESHTKHYHGRYGDIRKFLRYVVSAYRDEVEFGTMAGLAAEIAEEPSLVRSGGSR